MAIVLFTVFDTASKQAGEGGGEQSWMAVLKAIGQFFYGLGPPVPMANNYANG